MTKSFVGMSLILIVGAIYIYYTARRPQQQSTDVYGILAYPPDYRTTGGDFQYEYVILNLKGDGRRYSLHNCAYSSANLTQLNNLHAGDSLRIGVSGDTLKEEKLTVVHLYSMKHGAILKLDDVEYCYRQEWRQPFYMAVVILAVIVIKLVTIPLWRRFNRS